MRARMHHVAFEYETLDDLLINFEDWSKSSNFVRTSESFKANPIGMPVVPAKMLAARRAGVDAHEVQQEAYAGGYRPSVPMDPRPPFPLPIE